MDDRKKELLKIITKNGKTENLVKAERLVDEICFIEDQLVDMKKLPFISVSPNNPALQKVTPAARIYKELLQQYTNSLKLLFRISGDIGGEPESESPLRAWMRSRKELEGDV